MRTRRAAWSTVILFISLAAYLVAAVWIARTKVPWIDEGWNSAPVVNLLATGSAGTPSLEPTGSWLNAELRGIREYTFWILPLPIYAQAAWAKAFGASLFGIRTFSIACGLLCLLSWYAIVARVSGSRLAGALTVLIAGLDYTFVWMAADVRMDMMCTALGSAGLASYLLLRERNLGYALLAGNALAAAGLFTHPNGVVAVFVLFCLMVAYDRSRLHWSQLTYLTPYLVFAIAVEIYALQQPAYFTAQLGANAGARMGSRWLLMRHPVTALSREIGVRYLFHSGLLPFVTGTVPRTAAAVPFLYWLACVLAAATGCVRRDKGVRALLWILTVYFVYLTFSMKSPCYLVLILPVYAAIAALLVVVSHRNASAITPVAALLAGALLFVQVRTIVFKIGENAYGNQYLAAVDYLKRNTKPGEVVVAPSYFGGDLGFRNIIDDARVGHYSRVRPDLLVADTWYCRWWTYVFVNEDPETARYVRRLVQSDFRPVFSERLFTVYRRRGAQDPPAVKEMLVTPNGSCGIHN